MTVELIVSDSPTALLDEPLRLRARGQGAELRWRGRYRDDDGRVWKASAASAEELTLAWAPAKDGTGPVAALQSLRPLSIDVRVETPDGAAASRTLTRRLRADGVRSRRWREPGLQATLHLPAEPEGVPPLVLDATADPVAAALAAPLLASRGVLTLVVASGDPALAVERLAAVPAASGEPVVVDGLVLPPNVGTREAGAAARVAAWDAFLARVGARPRG